MLATMSRVSRRGIIAADLIRDTRAYAWITLFTLFANPMVKHDARVRCSRRFRRRKSWHSRSGGDWVRRIPQAFRASIRAGGGEKVGRVLRARSPLYAPRRGCYRFDMSQPDNAPPEPSDDRAAELDGMRHSPTRVAAACRVSQSIARGDRDAPVCGGVDPGGDSACRASAAFWIWCAGRALCCVRPGRWIWRSSFAERSHSNAKQNNRVRNARRRAGFLDVERWITTVAES